MKRSEKKKPHNLFGVGCKRKITVNGTAYPYLRWRSKSIHYLPNSKSGRGSFRHFYFSNITFHFYMYKGLKGIGAVEEKMNVYTFPHLLQNVDKGSDVYLF
jgi:hypothetical protein